MEERRPKTCRPVAASTATRSGTTKFEPDGNSSSSSSYFWVISVPQPKIRVRIPTCLAKAMQKRTTSGVVMSSGGRTEERKKRHGFAGFLSKVFGSCKRNSVTPLEFHGNGGRAVRKGDKGSVPESSLSLGRLLGFTGYGNGGDKGDIGGDHERSSKLESFSGLFSKGKAWNFVMRRRINKNGQRGWIMNRGSRGIACPNWNAATQWAGNSSTENSCSKFTRVPSRNLTTRPGWLKLARSLQNKARNPPQGCAATSNDNKERRNEGVELCKRKILLGGKCKPQIHSVVLGHHEECIWLR